MRRLGPNRILLVDTHSIRYLIPDVRRLDSASRRISIGICDGERREGEERERERGKPKAEQNTAFCRSPFHSPFRLPPPPYQLALQAA